MLTKYALPCCAVLCCVVLCCAALQPAPTCQITPLATGIRRVMVYAMLTIAFHMLMFFWHQPKGTIGKMYGLLPAISKCFTLLSGCLSGVQGF
jgi:hypothetical protein